MSTRRRFARITALIALGVTSALALQTSSGADDDATTLQDCAVSRFTHYAEDWDLPLDPQDSSLPPVLSLPTEAEAIAARVVHVTQSTIDDREDRLRALSFLERQSGDGATATWAWYEGDVKKGSAVLHYFGAVRGWRVVEEHYLSAAACD